MGPWADRWGEGGGHRDPIHRDRSLRPGQPRRETVNMKEVSCIAGERSECSEVSTKVFMETVVTHRDG